MKQLYPAAFRSYLQPAKRWLVCLSVVLLGACGSQDALNSASTTPADSQGTGQTQVATAADSQLVKGLETAYPNGQLPAELSAQAAVELAQNPAVLQYTAPSASLGSRVVSSLAGIFAPNVLQSPDTAYVTGQYKAVKRYRMPDGRSRTVSGLSLS